MSTSGFDLIEEAIDADLDHLHEQRWNARAAELHEAEDRAEGDEKERVRRELHAHYADRFRPETSRAALLEQARRNYSDRHPS